MQSTYAVQYTVEARLFHLKVRASSLADASTIVPFEATKMEIAMLPNVEVAKAIKVAKLEMTQ